MEKESISSASTQSLVNDVANLSLDTRLDPIVSKFNNIAGHELGMNDIQEYRDSFSKDPKNLLAMHTLSKQSYVTGLENRDVYLENKPIFNKKISLEGKITNQKSSGRCWLFAGLNVMRLQLMKKYNLENLELSQTYLFFYDKMEKSNWYLNLMEETADDELDGRVVQYLLNSPVQDGGQWDMFVALVENAGMDSLITTLLHKYGKEIRDAVHIKQTPLEKNKVAQEIRSKCLEEIYRILCVSLGTPPQKFDWIVYNKDKECIELNDQTPLDFYKAHFPNGLQQTISLIHDPRNEYFKVYTVKYLGNVVGASTQVRYINVPVEKMKCLAAQAIVLKNKPVWFGCDVGKFRSSTNGVLDINVIDYKSGFGIDGLYTKFSKAERLRYGESLMTHAMVLTGLQLESKNKDEDKTQTGTNANCKDDDPKKCRKVSRWRVENSWGEDNGNKGYLTMSNDWFNEFVYQIVLDFEDVPKDLLDLLTMEPIVLPPWDPMGALA
ncbi:Bleomycin hydrolase [Zancudomyces culisetae]|uniref:Cysteine proteinase 1, mitochondrial n=1 Tax=Zancudomyces culisetae TaxID=1213189 RepID=A0A1R1PV47_ZANCU|nr:Bleomycin hydrolase [Zancudomyces culisetae]OMH86150.1 Bleomycin hydrolase [Zancudomyces culisetae]|eukprot:OMH84821.1 Bleomycin hydrolase [Zancudomyces culisetae]